MGGKNRSIWVGVKAITLNARFRRKRVPLRTIGRTNYLPCEQALQLVELHRYALIGWPTLLAASKITDIKPGTLKAKCEKGRLEGHIDLTKRLRLNPAELGELCSASSLAEAKSEPPQIGSWAKLPARNNRAKALALAGMKEEAPRSEAEGATDTQGPGPVERTPMAQGNFGIPPAPKPKIEIISPKDYGLPEVESQPPIVSQRPQCSENAHKKDTDRRDLGYEAFYFSMPDKEVFLQVAYRALKSPDIGIRGMTAQSMAERFPGEAEKAGLKEQYPQFFSRQTKQNNTGFSKVNQ